MIRLRLASFDNGVKAPLLIDMDLNSFYFSHSVSICTKCVQEAGPDMKRKGSSLALSRGGGLSPGNPRPENLTPSRSLFHSINSSRSLWESLKFPFGSCSMTNWVV